MTTQLNLKFQDNFFLLAQEYANLKGYMSVQELIREALREKIFDELDVKPEYSKILRSKEANTYYSKKESLKQLEKLKHERVQK
ncbi:MAG: hypothetical protein ACI8Y7_000064 [Candidatus Woesearchaeota archaeon]|jgi:hypothetical protein